MRLYLLPLLALSLLWANEKMPLTKKSIELEIAEIKRQIEEEEKIWAEEKAREEEAEKRRTTRLEEFRAERSDLKTSLSSVENKIQASIQKIESLKNSRKAWENRFKVLEGSVLEQAEEFAKYIIATIPHTKTKRVEAVQLVVRDLRQGKISPEEGYSRLFAAYAKEHRLASEAELFSGEVSLQSGEKIAVKYIRVGKQLLAYSSPTGANVGILRKKNNTEWVWVREDELDFDSRQAIRNAVAVAEGKAVPGFVELPFWLSDFQQEATPSTPAPAEEEGEK